MSIIEDYYKNKGKVMPMRYRENNTLEEYHKEIIDKMIKKRQMEEEITRVIEENIIKTVENSLKKI